MTPVRWIIWIAMTISMIAVLGVVQYPIRKRRLLPICIILLIIKLIVSINFAYRSIAYCTEFIYQEGEVIVAAHIALFGDVLGDLISLPLMFSRKKESHVKIHTLICLLCTVAFLAFGSINMQIVTPNRLHYSSDKISKDYRFVFLADLHVGSSQSFKTTEKTISKIKAENPDFVLLGGDIFDELTTKEDMEKTLELFGELSATVYFIYGNHDLQPDYKIFGGHTFTQDDLENAMKKNGITLLKDNWIMFSDDIVLFGRDDFSHSSRKPLSDIRERPEDAFVILVDHSPEAKEDIQNSDADLQLSGHWHAGQIFPAQMLYRKAGRNVYGSYRCGKTELYVTSGAAGWKYPFRTESGCHFEVITLSRSNESEQ